MRRKLLTSVAVTSCVIAVGLAAGAAAESPLRTPREALRAATAPRSELVRTDAVDYRGFQVERFEQRIDGYPVIGGETTVVSAPGQPARLAADATDRFAAKADRPVGAPKLSRSQAIARARAAAGVRAIRGGDRPSASLAVDPSHGDALVWRAELPAARPMGDFEVLVDAASGRVLHTANLLQYARGKARLYVPNPPAEQGTYAGIGSRPAADRKNRNTKALTRLRELVRLPRLTGHKGCLKGKFALARVDHPAKDVCRRSRDWKGVKRADDRFEALMVYFHIDRTQAYIESLGFSKANRTGIDDRRQVAIADAFPADNSFYSPQDRKIRYGSGGIDDAEDGDVIVHEYGHSLQDNQDPGFGCHGQKFCEAGALGEGFGDYVSAMMTFVTPNLPNPTKSAFCVFDWDGVAGYNPTAAPCGRVADSSDGVTTLPVATSSDGPCNETPRGAPHLDIHCVGEVWTHGLIDIRLALGTNGAALDRDLLASQFTYVDRESFAQAVDALVQADSTLNQSANVATICNEMVGARGITGVTACPAA